MKRTMVTIAVKTDCRVDGTSGTNLTRPKTTEL